MSVTSRIGLLLASMSIAPSGLGALTIEDVRATLRVAEVQGGKISDISLAGYNFSRELTIGADLSAVVVSCQGGGGLVLFSPDGKLASTATTDEIVWVQLLDLDRDGVSEILTEEITGWGTGILRKDYVIYRVRSKKIEGFWRSESYFSSAPWSAEKGYRVSFGKAVVCSVRSFT